MQGTNDSVQRKVLLVLKLSDVFDERLLVRHSGVLSVAEDADVPEPKLHEALVDEVHGRAYIESHRRLLYC